MSTLRKTLALFVLAFLSSTTAFAATTDVSAAATSGSGTSGSPWAGWETTVNALPANSRIYFPAGYYSQASRIDMKRGWAIAGDGKDNSKIISSFTGTAFRTAFTVNSSNLAYVSIRDLYVENTNASNVGSGYLDVAGSYIEVSSVKFVGFRYGVTFDQSEIASIDRCEFTFQTQAGVWLVNGGDYNTTYADLDYSTASYDYTNVIHITRSEFNHNSGVMQIMDDGGYTHEFTGNNFNGGSTAIRMASVSNNRIASSEFEGQTSHITVMTYFTYHSSTQYGYCGTVVFDSNIMIPTSTNSCFRTDDIETLILTGNNISSPNAPAVSNGASANTIVNVRTKVDGNVLLDADPVRLIDLASDTTSGNLRINRMLQVKNGTSQGQATLSSGSKTVSNSLVTANTRVFLSRATAGTAPGILTYTVTSGSFTITSTSGTDNGVINWLLIEP